MSSNWGMLSSLSINEEHPEWAFLRRKNIHIYRKPHFSRSNGQFARYSLQACVGYNLFRLRKTAPLDLIIPKPTRSLLGRTYHVSVSSLVYSTRGMESPLDKRTRSECSASRIDRDILSKGNRQVVEIHSTSTIHFIRKALERCEDQLWTPLRMSVNSETYGMIGVEIRSVEQYFVGALIQIDDSTWKPGCFVDFD